VTDWFARPVLHVANVEASLRFYVDRLGVEDFDGNQLFFNYPNEPQQPKR
jgi:hypothetical protein